MSESIRPSVIHPKCDECSCRADGLTGNAELLCEHCLRLVYEYARMHVPESMQVSFDAYMQECFDRMQDASVATDETRANGG